jgi:hypothetical protein
MSVPGCVMPVIAVPTCMPGDVPTVVSLTRLMPVGRRSVATVFLTTRVGMNFMYPLQHYHRTPVMRCGFMGVASGRRSSASQHEAQSENRRT